MMSTSRRRKSVLLRAEVLEARQLLTSGRHLFDFGVPGSPVAPGYVAVTPETRHSAERGFGWLEGDIKHADRWASDPLDRDFNWFTKATFGVDLEPGTYSVTVRLGDLGPFGRDRMGVFAEGKKIGEVTTAGGQVIAQTYNVEVRDGRLDLTLEDLGGIDPVVVLTALEIGPPQVAPAVVPERYDFGVTGSPVAPGYAAVTPETRYSPQRGFGWIDGVVKHADRWTGGALDRDFNWFTKATFGVDLEPGTYRVTVRLGDLGPFVRDRMGVYAEGKLLGEVTTAAGQVVAQSYITKVLDGRLDLTLEDLGGVDPVVVLTALELELIAPAFEARLYDFGTAGSPTAIGAIQVTPSMAYDSQRGFGWTFAPHAAGDRQVGTDVHRDFAFGRELAFSADVPNGTYEVTAYIGDNGMWHHDRMALWLEGVQVDMVDTLPRQVRARVHRVTVTDRRLDLRMVDMGGTDPNVVLNGLQIAPIGDGLGVGAPITALPGLPADSPWRLDVRDAPVDPRSEELIRLMGWNTTLHPEFGTTYLGAPNGLPYLVVSGDQPKVPIHYTAYGDESDPGPFPIPPDAPIEGGPDGTLDRHVLVLDKDNMILYELFRAFPNPDGSWNAESGAKFDLKSNDLRPPGFTSADAAGLPILPGLVRWEEVYVKGEIDHALRFTVPRSAAYYVYPATHHAGETNRMDLPPMGLRVRLRPDFDVTTFPGPVQVILRAMQKHGMILADNGGPWYVSGAPDMRWDDALMSALRLVRGNNFEVIELGYTGPAAQAQPSTARGTARAGAWSDPATWGGVLPAEGDTVTINHAVTVDRDTAIGASLFSGSTPAIVVNAPLTVAPGVRLTVRGDVKVGNAALTLSAGATFEFDSSLASAPMNTRYVVQLGYNFGQPNARFVAEGTAAARATVASNPGGGAGRFVHTGGRFGPEGIVQARFTDFRRIGDAHFDAMQPWQAGWRTTFRLSDCSFTDSGSIRVAAPLQGEVSFILERVRFDRSLNRPVIFQARTARTSGDWRIEGCVFDGEPQFEGARDLILRGNYFHSGYAASGGRWAEFARNVVRFVDPAGLVAHGDMRDSYFFYDGKPADPRFVRPAPSVGNVTFDGLIFEAAGTSSGLAIHGFSPSAPTTYRIVRSIVLPNAGGTSSGTLFALQGNARTTLIAEHNTFVAGSLGATFGQSYAGHVGMIASFRANLAWNPAGPARGAKLRRDPNSAVPDVADPALVDFNAGWNLAPGSLGRGYSLVASTSGRPYGANDVDVNPQFLDATRNLAAWDRTQGGTGASPGLLARFLAGHPATTPEALLAFVRGGFAPTNFALKDASYPGDLLMSDIGAVPVANIGLVRGFAAGSLPPVEGSPEPDAPSADGPAGSDEPYLGAWVRPAAAGRAASLPSADLANQFGAWAFRWFTAPADAEGDAFTTWRASRKILFLN